MQTEDSSNWSAFLAGAFIGAGIALLVAPQSGSELRIVSPRLRIESQGRIGRGHGTRTRRLGYGC